MAQNSTLLRNDSDLSYPLYRIWRRGERVCIVKISLQHDE
ncbi:hypothetical protein SGB_02670 [Shigella boydii ATCC 9905]|nr:hypothetical protein SGB_02670 [Shigella boydii ATCC 9905]